MLFQRNRRTAVLACAIFVVFACIIAVGYFYGDETKCCYWYLKYKILKVKSKLNNNSYGAAKYEILRKFSDEKASRFIAGMLSDNDPQLRIDAIKTLAVLGAESQLVEALQSDDEEVRKYAVFSLGKKGGSLNVATNLCITIETDGSTEVRKLALSWLFSDSLAESVPLNDIINVLKSSCNVNLRGWAVWAIGERKDRQTCKDLTMPALISALGDVDRTLRFDIVSTLRKIGDKSAIEPLKRANLKENDDGVRKAITKAIDELSASTERLD